MLNPAEIARNQPDQKDQANKWTNSSQARGLIAARALSRDRQNICGKKRMQELGYFKKKKNVFRNLKNR